jgi:hypothetical protein
MIKNKEQIRVHHDWDEYDRRSEASVGTVQKLTTKEILEALKFPFTKEELRAERKRRMERLRYARIMANPYTKSLYRARKRSEWASLNHW